MQTVAVIGLGIMGMPMALNLLKAGYDVTGFNRSQEKVEAFAREGGRGVATLAEAVRNADVVLTVLPDSPDVESVILGPGGVLEHASAGALLIDASTIRPDVAIETAQAARAKGFRPLDCPVSGGEQRAIDGELSIMAGGEAADVAAARDVLSVIGASVNHVGPSGSGQIVKAANQLIVAGNIQLVAEALVFLEAHHVDMDAAVAALAGGLAGSSVLDAKARGMIDRSFEPGFRVELHHKDMGIATKAARDAAVAIPLSALVAQLVGAVRALGHGSLDHSALLLLVEQLSGHRHSVGVNSQ